MGEQQFTASLSRSQGRSAWCIIFRHPLRRDPQGHVGLRVRRGLGTSNRTEAERLKNQMNDLLSKPALWLPTARESVTHLYDVRIVDAFYDHLTPWEHDFWERRERVLPLPTPTDGYTRVLFVGTTGAGKTTIVRQLLGTNPFTERFPSTSAAKTTVCDMEIVFTEHPFRAVVTFQPKDTIQIYVEECIVAAVLAALENRPTQEIVRKLLEHTEQRFRLNYVLGTLPTSSDAKEDLFDDDNEDDEQDEMGEEGIAFDERLKNTETLQEYLRTVQRLAMIVRGDLETHPHFPHDVVNKDERDALLQELLEGELYKYDGFQTLVDDILDALEERFTLLQKGSIVRDKGGWPSYWTVEMQDRQDFLKTVNQFSSNYAPLFGRLLTPLVQGIRVAGPFQPEWKEGATPRLVLMDGEGLGHTADTATSLSTRITTRFEHADAIVLVDNASQPLQAAPVSAIKSVATGGHGAKLFLCFTHFDAVKGDNLPDLQAKRNHVLSSLENEITALSKEVGIRTSVALRNTLEERTFFVSNIQRKLSEKAKATRAELMRLLSVLEETVLISTSTEIRPVYDDTYLLLYIQRAVKSFREAWRGRLQLTTQSSRYPEHWTRIKALTRRPARLGLDEYDDLKPVADLIRELSEQIRGFLEKPLKWEHAEGLSDEMQQVAIDTITREMYTQFHILARKRLIRTHVPDWETAYSRSGTGSTRVRAHDIDLIYTSAAPIVDEAGTHEANEFLDQVIQLVRNAVLVGGGKLW